MLDFLAALRARAAERPDLRRHRRRQDDAAQRAVRLHLGATSASSRSKTRPNCSCSSEHVVRLETRPPNIEGKGAVRQRQLVINALRMRPDRIIVGEVRGEEALDMLQAMNTGHDGSLTTIHANTPRDALIALDTMIAMARSNLPERAMRQQIASAIQIVVQLTRLSDGTRKVTSISEITGMEGDVITMQDIFVFEKIGVTPDGKVIGRFRATGVRPKCSRAAQGGGHPPADAECSKALSRCGDVACLVRLRRRQRRHRRRRSPRWDRISPRDRAAASRSPAARWSSADARGASTSGDGRQTATGGDAAGASIASDRPDSRGAEAHETYRAVRRRERRLAPSLSRASVGAARRPVSGRPRSYARRSSVRSAALIGMTCADAVCSCGVERPPPQVRGAVSRSARSAVAGACAPDMRSRPRSAWPPTNCQNRWASSSRKCSISRTSACRCSDALNELAERVPLLDVKFFVTAVAIQRETGGNLAEILDNLAHVVRERFKIQRQVRAHTAHGRFTGFVLLALPAALAVALSFISPEHMELLVTEPHGQDDDRRARS